MKHILLAIANTFLDANGNASSKRVVGFIGYVCGMIMAFMKYDESTLALVLGSACSLLIGTAFERKTCTPPMEDTYQKKSPPK